MEQAGPRGVCAGLGLAVVALAVPLLLAAPARAAYPGANGQLAFDAAGGVAVVDSDGTNPRTLAPGADPSWDPTGSEIVYECQEAGVQQVCETLPDGSGQTSLTINGGADPQFTPGGDVVFVRTAGGFDQVFTMEDEGGEVGLTQRTFDARDHADPSFSAVGGADGDELFAFAADGDIWTTEVGEGEPVNLTHRYSLGAARHPDFSPDGTRIAFSAEGRIYVVASDGSGITQLTDPDPADGEDASPVFSPSGTRVAFSRRPPSGGAELWLIDANGGDPTPITEGISGVEDVQPGWGPVLPPLFTVVENDGAHTASCPNGEPRLGGGHKGIDMLLDVGDGEEPTGDEGWSVIGQDNGFDNPVSTSVTCGSSTYFQTGTYTADAGEWLICGPFYAIAPDSCPNDISDTNYSIIQHELSVGCDGTVALSGGFETDDADGEFGSGTTSIGSFPSDPATWTNHGYYVGQESKGTVDTSVTCLGPPTAANPAVARSAVTNGPNKDDDFWWWYAVCPDGSAAIGGGWHRTDFQFADSDYPVTDSYPVAYEQTPYGLLPTQWFIRMTTQGESADPDDTAVMAICAVLPSGLEAPTKNGALAFSSGSGGAARIDASDGAPGSALGGPATRPRWLPDASGFAFVAGDERGDGELRVFDDATDSVRPLSPGRRLRGSSAAFEPELRRFALARGPRGTAAGGIFVGAAVGGPLTRVTGGRRDRSLAWAPDGERIAFARGPGRRSAVWSVADEGGSKVRLSPRGLAASAPDYSPHGDRIVFAGRDGDCAALYTVSPQGGGAKRLTPCDSGAREPAWSPNGKRIAYAVRSRRGSAIVTIPASGGRSRIVERGGTRLAEPDWRPYPGRSGPRRVGG